MNSRCVKVACMSDGCVRRNIVYTQRHTTVYDVNSPLGCRHNVNKVVLKKLRRQTNRPLTFLDQKKKKLKRQRNAFQRWMMDRLTINTKTFSDTTHLDTSGWLFNPYSPKNRILLVFQQRQHEHLADDTCVKLTNQQ